MVILDSFILREDHYAYHVTNVSAMKSICQYGLKPLCGERSRSVGDSIKGIYFTDYFYSVLEWIDLLYKDVSVYDLEVLRFNLRNRKWKIKNENEFYLFNKVRPKGISYLRICDKTINEYLPLNCLERLDSQKELIWNDLNEYSPLVKKQ